MFLQVSVCPRGRCDIPACLAGGIPACLAAGLQGGWYPSMPCRFPGPHPRGKFRGIWQGGLQAHSQGGSLGGSGPGPQPRGKLRGIWSRPTAKGEVEGDLAGGLGGGCLLPGGCLLQEGMVEIPPADGYCCRWYASYWNAFLLQVKTVS